MTITCWKVSISVSYSLFGMSVCCCCFCHPDIFPSGEPEFESSYCCRRIVTSVSVFLQLSTGFACFFLFLGSTMLPRLRQGIPLLLLCCSFHRLSLSLLPSFSLRNFSPLSLSRHNVSIRCSSRRYKYTVFKCLCVHISTSTPMLNHITIKTPEKNAIQNMIFSFHRNEKVRERFALLLMPIFLFRRSYARIAKHACDWVRRVQPWQCN